MVVAVLALQGAFLEHEQMLKKLGAEVFEIRQKKDLERPFDALILPGGESTVMAKLMREDGLYEPLLAKIQAGLPVYGTCAGLILLAREVEGGTGSVYRKPRLYLCKKTSIVLPRLGSLYETK